MDHLSDPLHERLAATLTDPRHALPESLVSLDAVHTGAALRRRRRRVRVAGLVTAALVVGGGGATVSAWQVNRHGWPLTTAAEPDGAVSRQTVATVARPLTGELSGRSVTAASPSQFWLLGALAAGNCSGCLAAAVTTDSGATFTPVAVPAEARESRVATVLRVSGPRQAWLVSDRLWTTHDGAQSWHAIAFAGKVVALEASGPRVWAVIDRDGQFEIWRSPTTSDAWAPVPEFSRLTGPVELTAGGGKAFVISPTGLRVDDGTRVVLRRSPCGTSQPRHVSAITGALWLACQGSQGWTAYGSADAGVTFRPSLGNLPNVTAIGAHGVTDAFVLGAADKLVRVATTAGPAAVAGSPGGGGGNYIGFTTPRVGYAVPAAGGGIWRTSDSGQNWKPLAFGILRSPSS